MNIRIRDASAADADTVVGILIATKEQSLPHLVGDHDRDVPFWTARWRDYLTNGSSAQMSLGDGFALIAEVDDVPAAFAAYHHTTRHGADAELESLYVLPLFQGRGIGTELLRIIARRLHDGGSRSMCVGYDPENPYRHFYLKHGAAEIQPHWAVWNDLTAAILTHQD